MEQCTKIKEISEMETTVKRLAKIIDGNGEEGLYRVVIKLTESQHLQKENIDNLLCSVQVLRDSHIRTEAEDKLISNLTKDKRELERDKSINKHWAIGLAVTSVIAIIALVIQICIRL